MMRLKDDILSFSFIFHSETIQDMLEYFYFYSLFYCKISNKNLFNLNAEYFAENCDNVLFM